MRARRRRLLHRRDPFDDLVSPRGQEHSQAHPSVVSEHHITDARGTMLRAGRDDHRCADPPRGRWSAGALWSSPRGQRYRSSSFAAERLKGEEQKKFSSAKITVAAPVFGSGPTGRGAQARSVDMGERRLINSKREPEACVMPFRISWRLVGVDEKVLDRGE